MKNNFNNYRQLLACFYIAGAFLLNSCGDWTLPPELVGEWKSDKILITVNAKVEKEWVYISDTASITIKINSDHSVSGSIGKIFQNDPMSNKDVQLWLALMEGNRIDTELRLTEGMAQFPMAGMLLTKNDD